MASLLIKSIPPDLHARLKQRAAAHRRSLNSETILLLESVLGTATALPVVSGAAERQEKLEAWLAQPEPPKVFSSAEADLSEEALAKLDPAIAGRLRAFRELGESLACRGIDFAQWRRDAADSRR